MRLSLLLAVFLTSASSTGAQTPPQIYYWCDATRGWYPVVRTCPTPWRQVIVKPEAQQRNPLQAPTELLPHSEVETAPSPPLPETVRAVFPKLGDGLDDWCSQVRRPRSIALCSSAELRTLAMERQHAFDEAHGRLSPDKQKALLADQKEWLQTYAKVCGLSDDVTPSLPLSSALKDCMTQAGKTRITYPRTYGLVSASTNKPATEAPQGSQSELNSETQGGAPPTRATQNLVTGLAGAKLSENKPPVSSGKTESVSIAETLSRNAPVSVATTPPPSTNQSSPMNGVLIFILSVFSILLLIVLSKFRQKKISRQKIMQATNDLLNQHMRALVRRRFQLLRHDPYGNLIREPWNKELNYFVDTVLDPAIRQLGYKEFEFYQTMRRALLLTIDETIQRQAGSGQGEITFGPNLTPVDYEQYCAQQLRSAGWSANTTKGSGDQGTDIIAVKGDLRLVVQCKLYNHPVGNKAVQEVAAARTHEKADWAAVVSNARYTPAAEELAATNGVLLLHHTDLRDIDDVLSA